MTHQSMCPRSAFDTVVSGCSGGWSRLAKPGLAVWQEDVGCQWLCRAKGLWLDWSSCCMPEWWRMQVETVETVETWDLATLERDVRWFPSTSPKRWKTRSASPWFTDTATHVATKNRGGSCNALSVHMFQQNPTNLYAASCFLYGILVSDGEIALEGVTKIEGIARSAPAKQSSKLGIWPRIYLRACKEWCCQAALRAWHLDTVSTRGCKECPCQAIFRAWHLETVLTRACKEWHTALLRAWHCAAAKFLLQARRGCCQSLLTNLYGSMCMRRLW